jgi:hypothetical protein
MSSIYYDPTSNRFCQLDDKSVVPPGSREIEPDALEYYNGNRYISGILNYIDCPITLNKLKQAETERIPAHIRRRHAYETLTHKASGEPLLVWNGETLTVDAAVKMYLDYTAEGDSGITADIQALIIAAKAYIRETW